LLDLLQNFINPKILHPQNPTDNKRNT